MMLHAPPRKTSSPRSEAIHCDTEVRKVEKADCGLAPVGTTGAARLSAAVVDSTSFMNGGFPVPYSIGLTCIRGYDGDRRNTALRRRSTFARTDASVLAPQALRSFILASVS